MKSTDQLLLESAYAQVTSKLSYQEINRLNELDRISLEQLIQEGFFGDAAKWVGNKAQQAGAALKSGVQKAKETITSGVVNQILKALQASGGLIPALEMIVKTGQTKKVDPQIAQVAKQITNAPSGPQNNNTQTNESLYQNKQFLAQLLFTEKNILIILENLQNNGLLFEAKSKRDLQKYAKEVANKINEIYPKNKKAMAAAIPQFTNSVSKYLGIDPKTLPQQGANQQTSASQPQAASASTQQNLSQQGANQQTSASQPQAASAQQTSSEQESTQTNPPAQGGMISKIWAFMKQNPVKSAVVGAALIGLLVIAAKAAGILTVGELIFRFASSSATAGGSAILKQAIENKGDFNKIDYKQAGKTGLIGGGLGVLGSLLSTGLTSIVSSIGGGNEPISVGGGTEQQADNSYTGGGADFNNQTKDSNTATPLNTNKHIAEPTGQEQLSNQKLNTSNASSLDLGDNSGPGEDEFGPNAEPGITAPRPPSLEDQMKTAQEQGLIKPGQNVKSRGGYLVNANGEPLLPDPDGHAARAIDAAKQMKRAMTSVGGSQGGSGRMR